MFFILLHLFRGQGAEIFLAQTDYQKITGYDVVHIAIFITQGTIQVFACQLRFLIHDKSNGIFVGINRLNITAHSFLQILQLTADLHRLGIHIGTNQENIHHGSLFLLNLTLCLSTELYTGEVFSIQNMLGIVVGCLNLFLRSITIFSLHRDRLFQGLGDFYVILFQVLLPPFL